MNDFVTVIEILLSGMIALSGIFIAYILIAFYFPRSIMRPKLSGEPIRDRGLKKYVYEDGRGVVYEPEIPARKYIKQYLLFTKDGSKYVKCMVNPQVRYVSYSVLVFNNKNKLIDVISVEEQLKGETVTRAIPLDRDTSYVSLVLKKADNMYVRERMRLDYSYVSCAIYGVLSALVTAISGMLINSFVRKLFSASKVKFPPNSEAFWQFLLVGLVFGGVVALLYKLKYRKGIN